MSTQRREEHTLHRTPPQRISSDRDVPEQTKRLSSGGNSSDSTAEIKQQDVECTETNFGDQQQRAEDSRQGQASPQIK
ncbi:hypothetical protein F2P81_025403 [Scophthalmus maximus]|uniref:Uncharacterized protein n=1 Tax=Scophthalmus maximus TaxID=52904 RepID=A0A6A4RQK9_SCOMX|nr:hypothetical protein F2P81_025403 [Scophthalmus maximus]